MFRKFQGWLLTLILGVSVLAGVASSVAVQAQEDQPLVYATDYNLNTMNPILGSTELHSFIFRGLMKFDENNKPQMDIASEVDVSEDQLVYTISLRDDVLFHDGEKLKASDVVFTIESILDDANASHLKKDFELVKKIEEVDGKVVLSLSEPFTPLMDKLTVPILPAHAFKDQKMTEADFNQAPFGAGPYKFVTHEEGNFVEMETFEDYYEEPAKIEKVLFKIVEDANARILQMQAGEIDVAFLDPGQVSEVEKNDHLKVFPVQSSEYFGLMYNFRSEIFQDKTMRQALAHAVDREALVEGIFDGHGSPAAGPLQYNRYVNEDIKPYDYDLEKAGKMLEEADWKLDEKDGFRYKDGEKLAFDAIVPVTDTVRVDIANYLREEFAKVGADMEVVAEDWSTLEIEDHDAFLYAWGSPYDADTALYSVFHSQEDSLEGGQNYNAYANEEVDRLLEEGRRETNDDKRREIYQEIQAIMADDQPYIFAAYKDGLYGLDKDLEGMSQRALGHHGAGFLWNVETWTRE